MDELGTVFAAPTLFRAVDVLGVIANGLLGAIVARRMRFDLVGFLVIAMLSGLGGGIIRDLMLNVIPVALTDPAYLSGAFGAAIIGYLIPLRGKWLSRGLALADVLAVGCWTATGTIKALGSGLGVLPSLLLGVTTAVGGGMTRDVLIGRIPAVFGGNTLYATLAVVGAVPAWLLTEAGMSDLGMSVSIITCSVLGLLSRRYGWQLPGAPEWTLPLFRPRPPGQGPDSPQDEASDQLSDPDGEP